MIHRPFLFCNELAIDKFHGCIIMISGLKYKKYRRTEYVCEVSGDAE